MSKRRRPEKVREALFGVNPVLETLRAGRRKVYRIILKQSAKPGGAMRQIIDAAQRRSVQVDRADIDAIARMAGAEGHQGVVAQVSPLPLISLDKLIPLSLKTDHPVLTILDGVQDPRNFGAILRSAEALGICGVIFPSRRSTGYTPVAAKASAGAGEHMNLCRVTNIAETVKQLREEGFETIAFDSAAEEEFGAAPPGPLALILGGEGTGVRPLVAKRCGHTVRIPMKGRVGSLNVSAAAAIAFHLATLRTTEQH